MPIRDVLREYLNRPYEAGVHVRLTPTAPVEMQEAFENLPGEQQTIESGNITIKFKLLASGFVVERRSKGQPKMREWEYSIRSAKEFLVDTSAQLHIDLDRCERELKEVRRNFAQTAKAVALLQQAQGSLQTILSFDDLISSH